MEQHSGPAGAETARGFSTPAWTSWRPVTTTYSAPRWLSGRRRPPAEHRADLGSFGADPSRSSRAVEHAYNVAGIDRASSDDVASTRGNPISLLGAFQHLPRHA